jgi:hypothetical protein
MKKEQKGILLTNPNVAKDFAIEKNPDISLNELTRTSRKSVLWRCKNNHEYRVSVVSRIRSGGCKYCNRNIHSKTIRKSLLSSSLSLQDKFPNLTTEWDYDRNVNFSPDEVSFGSNRIVYWKCKCGREWQQTPKSRSHNPIDGCPACRKKVASRKQRHTKLGGKENSLQVLHPDIAAEWDHDLNELSADSFSAGSNTKVHWTCKMGHKWKATITNRGLRQSGCPFCRSASSRIELYTLCEIRSVYPSTEWRRKFDGVECDVYIPDLKLGIEIDGGFWHKDRLEKDREKNRFFRKLSIEVVRLRDSTLPHIDCQYVSFTNGEDYQSSTNRLIDFLSEGYDHFGEYSGTQQCESEFKRMSEMLPAPAEGDSLLDLYPEISGEWNQQKNEPLLPEYYSPGSGQKVWWLCEKDHEWQATIKNRTKKHSGCPQCSRDSASDRSRLAALKRGKSLTGAAPHYLLMFDYEKNDLEPHEIPVGTKSKLSWKCVNGHSFKRSGENMAKNQKCAICRSFVFLYPEIAKQWNYERNIATPDSFSAGSSKKVWWTCPEGHSWQATILHRSVKRNGCPTCFNSNRSKIYMESAAKRVGSIAGLSPELLKEWDYEKNEIDPQQITPKSTVKVWWRCKKGHSYKQIPVSKHRGSICPLCANQSRGRNTAQRALKSGGSLESNFPRIAKLWDYQKNGSVNPSDISRSTHTSFWWKCSCGHEWEMRVNQLTDIRRKYICPSCKHDK